MNIERQHIYQRPVTGLSLEPTNFAVILWASWIDMGMTQSWPKVGLS